MGAGLPDQVVVHPLVLLSVVDHYTRVAKDTRKRTVGVLLGQYSRGRIDVTNSYAVPFEVRLGAHAPQNKPKRAETSATRASSSAPVGASGSSSRDQRLPISTTGVSGRASSPTAENPRVPPSSLAG